MLLKEVCSLEFLFVRLAPTPYHRRETLIPAEQLRVRASMSTAHRLDELASANLPYAPARGLGWLVRFDQPASSFVDKKACRRPERTPLVLMSDG